MRPPRIWARQLAARLPKDTPFAGIAVMIPTLTSVETPIALAMRPDAGPRVLQATQALTQALGLTDA